MGGFLGGMMGGGAPEPVYQPAAAVVAPPPAPATLSNKPAPTPVGGEDALKAKRAKTSSLLSTQDNGSTLLGG